MAILSILKRKNLNRLGGLEREMEGGGAESPDASGAAAAVEAGGAESPDASGAAAVVAAMEAMQPSVAAEAPAEGQELASKGAGQGDEVQAPEQQEQRGRRGDRRASLPSSPSKGHKRRKGCGCKRGCKISCACKKSTRACTEDCGCGEECTNKTWKPCKCDRCSPECTCRAGGFHCQAECTCRFNACSNTFIAMQKSLSRSVARVHALHGLSLGGTDDAPRTPPSSGRGGGHGRGGGSSRGGRGGGRPLSDAKKAETKEAAKDKEDAHEEKQEKGKEKEMKTMNNAELQALVGKKDQELEDLKALFKRACEDIKSMDEQVQEITRSMTKVRLDNETKEVEMRALEERVKRMETKNDVAAFGAAVAARGADSRARGVRGGDAKAKAPVQPGTHIFLFTGVREADDWETDEAAHVRARLAEFKCGQGILRIERLGRRKEAHRGGGRFVLVEYKEHHVQDVVAAKEELGKKGIAARDAKQGFRYPAQPQHRPRRAAQLRRPSVVPPGEGPSSRRVSSAGMHHQASHSRRASLASLGMQQGSRRASSAQARAAPKMKDVCYPFQHGKCVEGSRCKEQHVRVCFNFADGRRCNFGDSCKFEHMRWDGRDWQGAAGKEDKEPAAGRGLPAGFGWGGRQGARSGGGGDVRGRYVSTVVPWPSRH